MRRLILAAWCVVPTLVFAQSPPQLQQPAEGSPIVLPQDMVLIPRGLIPSIEQAVLHPHSVDPGDILTLVQEIDACVADNPTAGAARHTGPDQCPVVARALATLTQELAAAKK